MSQENVEVARRGFGSAMAGDYEAIAEILDPEVRWHGGEPGAAGGCENREQVLEFMRLARRRRPLGELVEVIDADDKVIVVVRPDPDDPSQVVANLSTFRGGKVVEMVHFPDVESALVAARSSRPG